MHLKTKVLSAYCKRFSLHLERGLAEEDLVYLLLQRPAAAHAVEGSEDASQLIAIYYRSFFLTLDSEPQIWSPGQVPELTGTNERKRNQEEEKLSIHALG